MSESTTAPASAEGSAPAPDSADYDPVIAAEIGAEQDAQPAETIAEASQEGGDDPEDAELANRDKRALYAELKRVRERAQRAEQEAKARAEEAERHRQAALRVLEARTQQQPTAQAPQQIEIPDIETDPVGHFKAKTALLEQQLRMVAQPVAMQAQEAQFAQAVRSQAAQFAAQTPDYQDAYKHAWGVMERMAQALGSSPQAIERMIAAQALQAGRNPGQAMYEFAKASGFAGPKPPAAEPEKVIETLERGQQAARSVGGGGGRAPQRITIDAIANMSQAEYDALYRKNPELVDAAYKAAG